LFPSNGIAGDTTAVTGIGTEVSGMETYTGMSATDRSTDRSTDTNATLGMDTGSSTRDTLSGNTMGTNTGTGATGTGTATGAGTTGTDTGAGTSDTTDEVYENNLNEYRNRSEGTDRTTTPRQPSA